MSKNLAAFLCILLFSIVPVSASQAPPAEVGEIERCNGEAIVKTDETETEASPGAKLHIGDSITIAEEGVRIDFRLGVVEYCLEGLAEGAKAKIVGHFSARTEYGKMRLRHFPEGEVAPTPHANIYGRGTDFVIVVRQNETMVGVSEGKVRIERKQLAGESIVLPEGNRVRLLAPDQVILDRLPEKSNTWKWVLAGGCVPVGVAAAGLHTLLNREFEAKLSPSQSYKQKSYSLSKLGELSDDAERRIGDVEKELGNIEISSASVIANKDITEGRNMEDDSERADVLKDARTIIDKFEKDDSYKDYAKDAAKGAGDIIEVHIKDSLEMVEDIRVHGAPSARRAKIVRNVLLGTFAVAAVTSAVLLLTRPDVYEKIEDPDTWASLDTNPDEDGSIGLAINMRF